MPNSNDYTVGWICAVETEYVAAKQFLHPKHSQLDHIPAGDTNGYALGRMGNHNVVIAVLPAGEYGIASAANVATNMLRSFPNIRIGLMVGIGGGAPTKKHDIRLGDVVVSYSSNGRPCVFQYDFGKTIQNKVFQPTGFLNLPPTALRTAVNILKGNYKSDGHDIAKIVKEIAGENWRLREYKKPPPSTDKLYKSNVVHCDTEEDYFSDDDSKLKSRPQRSERDDDPVIHYGVIASGNQLMKDALIRDRLAAEKDILCFEMEAAGLMNHFPCLVIRGICDYSDSHKTKEWQGYAAMTAAAYARDLLDVLTPAGVEAERRIEAILSNVNDTVSVTRTKVEGIRSQLDHKEDLEVLQWITPVDYGRQHSDLIGRRQENTGLWLLDSKNYQTWIAAKKQTLFCHGIPGAGKTMLTAFMVEEITGQISKNPEIGLAYIYCSFQRQKEQNVEDLAASLLKQLSQGRPSLPSEVRELHCKHQKRGTRPSLQEIIRALNDVAGMYSTVFVVVDALDECTTSVRSKILSFLIRFQEQSEVNLFLTARPILDVEHELPGCLTQEVLASDEDLHKYIDGRWVDMPLFLRPNLQIHNEVKQQVTKACRGMFLLAQLYLDTLSDKTSTAEVRAALRKLSFQSAQKKGGYETRELLDEAYEEAMGRVEKQTLGHRELAMRALSWIFCARRPLTTPELQHALAVQKGDRELDGENIRAIEDIVSVCAGLVMVDTQTNIIRVVHYTTQEYFERTKQHWFSNAESEITTVCAIYLSFRTFESGCCADRNGLEERLRDNALYDYAVHHWGHHARDCLSLPPEVMDFISRQGTREAAAQGLFDSNITFIALQSDTHEVRKGISPMHLSAVFGVREAVRLLLQQSAPIDICDSLGWTPLFYATYAGQENLVQFLLDKGASVSHMDSDDLTALDLAMFTGQKTIFKLLVEKKITNNKDSLKPLHLAASTGNEAEVELLVDQGADIDETDVDLTPLEMAIVMGHDGVVQILLDHVMALSPDSERNSKILYYAALTEQDQLIKLLKEKGFKMDFQGEEDFSPLHLVVMAGNERMARLLLEMGSNPDGCLDDDFTPLCLAAAMGNEKMVRLLLEMGADPEFASDDVNPMIAAATAGHEKVVRLLLENDVSPDSDCGDGMTAVHSAASNGSKAVLIVLLEEGNANPDCASEDGITPLHLAAQEGHLFIIEILLQKGVSLNPTDEDGHTPLDLAITGGHSAVVNLLKKNGASRGDTTDEDETARPNSNDTGIVATSPLSKTAEQRPVEKQGLLSSCHLGISETPQQEQGNLALAKTISRRKPVKTETIRVALDQSGELGSLYNCCLDRVLPQRLFKSSPTGPAVQTREISSINCNSTLIDSLPERFSKLNLCAELRASFLAGLVNPSGSATYLSRTKTFNQQASVICSFTSKTEHLCIDEEILEDELDQNALNMDATHVICGIEWGARSIVTVGSTETGRESSCLDEVIRSIAQASDGVLPYFDDKQSSALEFQIHSDLAGRSTAPSTYEQACKFVSKVPGMVSGANNGKGVRLTYYLAPISQFTKEVKMEFLDPPSIQRVDETCIEKFVALFEELNNVKQRLNDYYQTVSQHEFCVPQQHIRRAKKESAQAKMLGTILQSKFAQTLVDVRSDALEMSDLWDLLEEYTPQIPALLAITDKYTEKIKFADNVVGKGVIYTPDKLNLPMSLGLQPPVNDLFIIYINEATSKSAEWAKCLAIISDHIDQPNSSSRVVVVDCDLGNCRQLQKPVVEQYRGQKIIVPDVVSQQEYLATKCWIRNRCQVYAPQPSIPAIPDRRQVEIPCPRPECASRGKYEWACLTCGQYIYYQKDCNSLGCTCGIFPLSEAEFKCNSLQHGRNFAQYGRTNDLYQLMQGLDPLKEYNILILGETGVGKSTFINAFINYLMFDSLEDALQAPGPLQYAIPSSFRYDVEVNEQFETHLVQVGQETSDEKYSTQGESATQKTKTYEFNIRNRVIRLIDTPGIGDTRGINQDYDNIADVLDTLESIDKLSTVLFLLKPNSSRLGPTFNFCMTELLSRLHRDTSKNIVFGFTNARSTGYTLGDTREPLEALLRMKKTNIRLSRTNLFFFDSESFRFLAAYKQTGQRMPHQDDYNMSWTKSSAEARRLINTTFCLPVHCVRKTLSLNRTRVFICNSTKPMIAVSTAILQTQTRFQDQRSELDNVSKNDKNLAKKLKIEYTVPERHDLDRPRTVCTHENCTKVEVNPLGERTTVYKTICHDVCYIQTPDEVTATPELAECNAFNNLGQDCVNCSHGWKMHMHISYDLTFKKVSKDDDNVVAELKANKNLKEVIEKRMATIQADLLQLQKEEELIKSSLAQFGVYLAENAMAAYNDATINYLDHLISAKNKEGRVKEAIQLMDQKAAYETQLHELKRAVQQKQAQVPDEEQLDQVLKSLYQMPMYGKVLRDAMSPSRFRKPPATRPKTAGPVTSQAQMQTHLKKLSQSGITPASQGAPMNDQSSSISTNSSFLEILYIKLIPANIKSSFEWVGAAFKYS